MGWTLRKKKSGEVYWSFTYYNSQTGKTVRVAKELTEHIKTDEHKQKWHKSFMSSIDASRERIKKRVEWKKKYIDRDQELEEYISDRKKKSPNNWQNDVIHLEKYVFYFFLTVKDFNNYNVWPEAFMEFTEWLSGNPEVRKHKKAGLSTSSKNHIIKALNAFMKSMYKRGKVSGLHQCEYFDRSTIGRRGLEDLISKEELGMILDIAEHHINEKKIPSFKLKLRAILRLMYHGGFRANEALGLTLFNLKKGMPDNTYYNSCLEKYGIPCKMHIILESQLANDFLNKIRDENGNVVTKPLKGKKVKKLEFNRVVPLGDEELLSDLIELRKEQLELMKNMKYGTDLRNYLIFDGLSYSVLSNRIRDIYKILMRRYPQKITKAKTAHCFRHQYGTDMALKVKGDIFFVSMLLGHSERSPKTTLNYVHLAEQVRHQASISEEVIEDWDDLIAK